MGAFCAALRFDGRATDFNALRRICGGRGGCAFVSREFSVIYTSRDGARGDACEPVTVRHNGHLYTAAVIADAHLGAEQSIAREVLEGYLEEGERYVHSLDFPYAMLIFDGRCAELLACRSPCGGFPLFFAARGSELYVSSSLTSLFGVLGGCVRVNKSALRAHVCGGYGAFPHGLFCDIHPIERGRGMLCTRFGESRIDVGRGEYNSHARSGTVGLVPDKSRGYDVRQALSEALLAYGYPQFDAFMPAFIAEAKRAEREGIRNVRIQDGTLELCEEYAIERAYLLSELLGTRVTPCAPRSPLQSRRSLRALEKEIDALLAPLLQSSSSVLYSLFERKTLLGEETEKSIPLRIRRRGMLYQTAMWIESFGVTLE